MYYRKFYIKYASIILLSSHNIVCHHFPIPVAIPVAIPVVISFVIPVVIPVAIPVAIS